MSVSNDEAILDRIFAVALEGGDADITRRKDDLWIAGITLLADVLLRTDQLKRERLLRGLQGELREALTGITRLMHEGLPPLPALPRYPEVPDGPRN
jgi:hypothetical protein